MKVYSPNDIASLLNISAGTLRKYSRLLEKYGYQIGRNSQGHRFYQDKDILTLRNISSAINSNVSSEMSLEETVQNVVSLEKGSPETAETVNTPSNELANTSELNDLKEVVNTQNELLRQLSERMDQQSKQITRQQEYIDKQLAEINSNLAQSQDEYVMQSINQVLDNRKRIAAEKELQEQQPQKKKGFWAWLFGKGGNDE